MQTLQFTNTELNLLFDAVDMMNDGERDMTSDEIDMIMADQSLGRAERMKKINEVIEKVRALTALRERLAIAAGV
jgi:hypothetical protein